MVSPTVTIKADKSQVDQAIDEVKSRIQGVWSDTSKAEQQIQNVVTQGTQLLNVVLARTEQAAALQTLQAGQQVVSTQISVNYLRIQAAAAFALGTPWGYAQGTILAALAVNQEVTLAQSLAAQIQAQSNEAYTERINDMRYSYG